VGSEVIYGRIVFHCKELEWGRKGNSRQAGFCSLQSFVSHTEVKMSEFLLYVLLGLIAGAFSGLIGLGGGVIIVPALVFIFGMSQIQAQGTTLALLVPPIGILAAWTYYKHGHVDVKVAAFICLGFVVGSLVGARVATSLSNDVLQKIFGVALLVIGIKMIFFK
jgi:uncharacterized protein